MKQEIKERVERIREGEVPEGYKETKVGIIPDDWNKNKLSKLGFFKNGINKDKRDFGHGNPLISLNDVFGKKVLHCDDHFESLVNCSKNDINNYDLKEGDVLFVRSSVKPEGVGLTAVIDTDIGNTVYSGFIIRYRITAKLIKNFRKYVFDGFYFRKKMLRKSTISANTNVSQDILNSLEIIFPSESEQDKIAEILSTWDKAIELKEKLIEEKKELKRGLMQKLLTGETRFLEFTGDWAEIPLKNIVKRITTKNKENNKTVITISAKKGFVNQDEYFNKLVASKDLSGYFLIKKGDFAYNKSYSNGYPVGAIKRLDSFENAVVTTLYICFRIKDEEVSSNFLRYYFDSGLLNRQIRRIANEGGRAHGLLNVTPSDFFNIKVNLPEYEEQEKISATLLVNGQNIQLLEQEIFELKEQKKGLMQLLLTGIVRVEVD